MSTLVFEQNNETEMELNATSTISVKLSEGGIGDAPMEGEEITWLIESSSASLSTNRSTTDVEGIATVDIISGNDVETATVTASALPGVEDLTEDYTMSVIDSSVTDYTIRINSTNNVEGGFPAHFLHSEGGGFTVTATIRDGEGNLVDGVEPVWSVTPNLEGVVLGSGTPSVNGIATNTIDFGPGIFTPFNTSGIVTLSVSVDDSSNLHQFRAYDSDQAAVTVTNGQDGILTQQEIATGDVVAFIPVAIMGQAVVCDFHWGHAIESEQVVDDPLTPLTVDIEEVPCALLSGTYTVFYDYFDLAQNITCSVPFTIFVANGIDNGSLLAPSITDAADGTININDISDGLEVVIPSQPENILNADLISVYFTHNGVNAPQLPIKVGDGIVQDNTAETILTLEGEQFINIERATANFLYTVNQAKLSEEFTTIIDTLAP